MENDFYNKMFISKYRNKENLKEINCREKFCEAILYCTSEADIDKKWKENYDKFIMESLKENKYITEGNNIKIGATLGEMSLSYYKYNTQQNDDWDILVVDQPEDNISNNNISNKLIEYFNSIRYEKQLIFVTHNPLLVVNLDADNVIYLENKNDKILIKNGCLEEENDNYNILDIVAENMDGGRESIEKRLKVYGKYN